MIVIVCSLCLTSSVAHLALHSCKRSAAYISDAWHSFLYMLQISKPYLHLSQNILDICCWVQNSQNCLPPPECLTFFSPYAPNFQILFTLVTEYFGYLLLDAKFTKLPTTTCFFVFVFFSPLHSRKKVVMERGMNHSVFFCCLWLCFAHEFIMLKILLDTRIKGCLIANYIKICTGSCLDNIPIIQYEQCTTATSPMKYDYH